MVLAVLCLVWLVYKFGDLPIQISKIRSFKIYVQFPTAQGVQTDTPVRFCGYQIGRVTKIIAPVPLPDLKTGRVYHQTTVVMHIDKKYVKIPDDVEVKVMTRGLGSSYIELIEPKVTRDPGMEVNYLADGKLMQGTAGITSEFFPAQTQMKMDKLFDNMSALLENANIVIGDLENREHFKSILANLAEASRQATETLKVFQQFSATGTETFEAVDTNVDKVVTSIVATSEEMSKTIAELRSILIKINQGQGTVGRLINDGRLYENLLENTQQMQLLLEKLKGFMVKDKGLPIKLK